MVFNFAAHVMVFPALKSSGTAVMSTSRVVGIANETMVHLLIFYIVTRRVRIRGVRVERER